MSCCFFLKVVVVVVVFGVSFVYVDIKMFVVGIDMLFMLFEFK